MRQYYQVHKIIMDKGEITASEAELCLKKCAAVVSQLERDVLADLAAGNLANALDEYDEMVRYYKDAKAKYSSLQKEVGKLNSLPAKLGLMEETIKKAAAAIKAKAQSEATAKAKKLNVPAGEYVYSSGDFYIKATVAWAGDHSKILITWHGKRAPSQEEWDKAKKGKPEELNTHVMSWLFEEEVNSKLQF